MESLFPYTNWTTHIQVNPGWLSHAQKHAEACKVSRNTVRVSTWDIATRVCEIAIIHIFGLELEGDRMPLGKWSPRMGKCGLTVRVSGRALDPKHNMGSMCSLIIPSKGVSRADIHICAIFDPPFVDLIGYAMKDKIRDVPKDRYGRIIIPQNELTPITRLFKYFRV